MTHMKVNFAMEDGKRSKKGGNWPSCKVPHFDAETHCVRKKIGLRTIRHHQCHLQEAMRLTINNMEAATQVQAAIQSLLQASLLSSLFSACFTTLLFTSQVASLLYSIHFLTLHFSLLQTSLLSSLLYLLHFPALI